MIVTPRVELRLSGVWTDVTADVLRRDGLRWGRGIFEQGPLARVARPGYFSFTLNNSQTNTAQTVGYYSPGHASVRAGFQYGIGVRLRLTDGTNTRYVWRGTLRVVGPQPGVNGPWGTPCVAVDWMALFAESDAVDLMLREAVRPDELIQDLIDAVETAPALTDLEVGQDEYPFAFDDIGGEPPKCPQVAQDIVQSEGGFFYVRGDATEGETVVFENRFTRALASTVATFTSADMADEPEALDVPSSVDHIVNDVAVLVVPRRVDTDATSVLVRLDTPMQIEAGEETIELFLDYRDPNNNYAEYVGGKTMQAAVANTDWTANSLEDGSGADLTASVTVTVTYFGSRCMVEITNNAATSAYVRGPAGAAGLQLRGRGLYRYAPIASRATNATSIAAVGARQLPSPMVMPYQDDRRVGQDIATFIANLWGSLEKIPSRVRVLTERNATLAAHGINRDIGDRIELEEEVTGVDATVFINGLEQELDENDLLRTWWTLAPADTTDLIIFDFGRFDESAFGYG